MPLPLTPTSAPGLCPYSTGGEIFIGGHPLSDPLTRLAIGYCPQSDPLFDLLTARETLWFYGRIRGVEKGVLLTRIEKLIEQVRSRLTLPLNYHFIMMFISLSLYHFHYIFDFYYTLHHFTSFAIHLLSN